MYLVVKTVKGRRYLYEQQTWREGKRVRTQSRYIGPLGGGQLPSKRRGVLKQVGDFIKAQGPLFSKGPDEERFFKQHLELEARRNAAIDAKVERLHELYGLRMPAANPVPVEPQSSSSAKENSSEVSSEKK